MKKLQYLVGLLSFAAKIVCSGRAFLRRLYDALAKGGRYLHWFKPIGNDLLGFFFDMKLHCYAFTATKCYSLWSNASGFCSIGRYFFSEHYTLREHL